VALFGKKKDQPELEAEQASEVEVHSADKDRMIFTPQPDKARRWFEHGRAAADSGNHEYALHCFAIGIRFDPEDMSVHRDMYDSAVRFLSKGGKAAKSSEIKKIEGPHAVDKFAAAEFAWMHNLTSASLALRLIQATVKAEQNEFGRWFAPKLLNVLAKQKKPSKSEFLTAMEQLREVGAWDEALKAGAKAFELDPSDVGLSAELKNITAQRAMDQGGYEETAGQEGGFRKFVRDEEKQRQLEEEESLSGAGSSDERVLARAKQAYDENPATPDAIQKYAQLLRKSGRPEDEELAKKVYLKGFAETKEYRFRMAASDLTIRQGERRVAQLTDRVEQSPDDDDLRRQLDDAERELRMYKASEYAERVERYPSDRMLKYQLGMVEFELGNFEAAMGAFQQSKDEPRLRVLSGHRLGLCFAQEGWQQEAIGEFKEALDAIDATTRDYELPIRYDLMVSLIQYARDEQSIDLAKEALDICSSIARKDITYRDIRVRRKEIDELMREISG